jgi:predicted DNA-binding protein
MGFIGFLIEKEQKETFKALADLNKTTTSAILRTFIEMFITDMALQNRILEGVKRNVVYDSTLRQPLSKPAL